MVLEALNETTCRRLEELMQSGTYTFQSEFAKKYFKEGEAKGEATGEAKGRAEGEATGRAEGEATGRIKSLLESLEARGLECSDEQRARIEVCADLDTLDTWIRRALRVDSLAEVLDSAG